MEISHKHRKTKQNKTKKIPQKASTSDMACKEEHRETLQTKLTKQSDLITVLNFYKTSRNLEISNG